MTKRGYTNHAGFRIGLQQGCQFDIFQLGFHHHFGDDEEYGCEVRHAVMLTVLGLTLIIGTFRLYK